MSNPTTYVRVCSVVAKQKGLGNDEMLLRLGGIFYCPMAKGKILWCMSVAAFFKLISKTNKLQNKQKRHSTFNERKRQYFFVKYNCCCCLTGAFYFQINFN